MKAAADDGITIGVEDRKGFGQEVEVLVSEDKWEG